ncbi:MAG: metal ABC transporter permease, partial [Alphaproteobacteria bacterium]|nr:metal ABC transporter permease [Alphaproteobacteria bacterium]
MPPIVESPPGTPPPSFVVIRRFLHYLWPKDAPMLRVRVVVSLLLVLASIGATLTNAYALKWAIDRMTPALRSGYMIALLMVGGYVLGRFASVLFDNLRNGIFERVGQVATQKLAVHVFQHLHELSLRFHLDRRTGAVSKVIERGTKSIDTMLYFILFNIAPTVIQLVLVLGIFWKSFGLPLFAATLVAVACYIVFTWFVTNWRSKLRVQMNDMDTNAMARAVDSLLNYETVKY